MKRRRVILSAEAIADIEVIAAWLTEEASGAVARRYVGRVKASLAKFAFASERGTVRNEIMDGLRVVGILGSASVAFRASEDRVTILRVFHGGQDWQSALTADDDNDD